MGQNLTEIKNIKCKKIKSKNCWACWRIFANIVNNLLLRVFVNCQDVCLNFSRVETVWGLTICRIRLPAEILSTSIQHCQRLNKTGLQPVLRPVEQVHYFGGCKVPLVPRLYRETNI